MDDEKKQGQELLSSYDATDSFLFSEKDYVENGLKRGVETFMNRLFVHIDQNKTILSEADITKIFSAYKVIYQANDDFLNRLMAARMNRQHELRDVLGQVLDKFIPYLKVYLDYTLKKQGAIGHMEKLTKSSKKFAEFLKINEACVNRSLKSFLEEPIARLPQYLQLIGNIYVAWDREDSTDRNPGKKELFGAIVNIKKVTDEIAEKIKNKKARRLVAHLQRRIFNNKIMLIASHRYVVTHGMLKMVNKRSLSEQHFVLCNDVLLVVKPMKHPSAKALNQVFPLIGMKIIEQPEIPKKLQKKVTYTFGIQALLTSEIKQLAVVCADHQERENWIEIIRDTVDEEEHSLHPCNPIDLEKRLRQQQCSQQGIANTLTVTDPARVKEIHEWKKWKAAGSQTQRRRLTNLRTPPRKEFDPSNSYGGNNLPSPPNSGYGGGSHEYPQQPQSKPPGPPSFNSSMKVKSYNALPKPPSSSPPAHAYQGGGPPSLSSINSGGPPSSANKRPPAHQARQFHSFGVSASVSSVSTGPPAVPSGMPPRPNFPPPSAAQAKQTMSSMSGSSSRSSIRGGPPSFGGAPSPPGNRRPPGFPGHKKSSMSYGSSGGGPPPPPPNVGGGGGGPRGGPPRPGPPSIGGGGGGPKRAGFLAGIANFDRTKSLKQISEDDIGKPSGNQDVDNLLVDTLANYRQFVMDDDDDDDSDGDWD